MKKHRERSRIAISLLAAGNVAWLVASLFGRGESDYATSECETASLTLRLIEGASEPLSRRDVLDAARVAGQKVYRNDPDVMLVGSVSVELANDKVVRIERMFGPQVCK